MYVVEPKLKVYRLINKSYLSVNNETVCYTLIRYID